MVLKLLLQNQMANGIKITVTIQADICDLSAWIKSIAVPFTVEFYGCFEEILTIAFLLWLCAMPNITVLMLPVSGSVTKNSKVINPFEYNGLNYLLTFSCMLSASDYKSPQYSFFTVYINIQDSQRGRRGCRCNRKVMIGKDRVTVLCVAFKVLLMSRLWQGRGKLVLKKNPQTNVCRYFVGT